MLNFFRKMYKIDINVDSDKLSFTDFYNKNNNILNEYRSSELNENEQEAICPVSVTETRTEGMINLCFHKKPFLEKSWIKYPEIDSLREKVIIENTLYIHWKIESGDYVEKGEVICEYKYKYREYNFESSLIANYSGIVEVYSSKENLESNKFSDGDKVYSIIFDEISESSRVERIRTERLKNTPLILTDNFSLKKEIKWEKVGGETYILSYWYRDGVELHAKSMNKDLLFFTVNYKDDKDYIVFRYRPKEFKLPEGSSILFKFENDDIIQFDLDKKPHFITDSEGKKLGEFYIQLTESDLKLFTMHFLNNWKINFHDSDLKIEGELSSTEKKFGIRLLLRDYCTIIKREIEDYKPLTIRKKVVPTEETKKGKCYLYLMLDNSNGYHKIGISNKPEYREKTLQSEKPDIEMMCNKAFPVRKIAYSFEQALHQSYAEKRIRGEWFNLSEEEVNEIKEALK